MRLLRQFDEALPWILRILGFALLQELGAVAALILLGLGAPFALVLGAGFTGTLAGFYVAFGLMRG